MISVIMDGVRTISKLLYDLATFIWLMLRPHGALVAENLFLRKQLAFGARTRSLLSGCFTIVIIEHTAKAFMALNCFIG